MFQPSSYSAERLADRAQIQDVIYRWCRAIDRLDLAAIRDVFHADAIDAHGMYEGNIAGLLEWIKTRHAQIVCSTHAVSNILIEFTGEHSALVETYCVTMQRHESQGQGVGGRPNSSVYTSDMVATARYVDRFQRRSTEWRIQHRQVVYDSMVTLDGAADKVDFGDACMRGRRDHEDYLFTARASEGLRD